MTGRYGSPQHLFNSRGKFYDMIHHSGDMEELQELLVPRREVASAGVAVAG